MAEAERERERRGGGTQGYINHKTGMRNQNWKGGGSQTRVGFNFSSDFNLKGLAETRRCMDCAVSICLNQDAKLYMIKLNRLINKKMERGKDKGRKD